MCRSTVVNTAVRAVLVLACTGLVACLEVKEDQELEDNGNGCDLCHELGEDTPHVIHTATEDRNFGPPMECVDCHVFPTDWFEEDSNHLNANLDIVFAQDSLAMADGLVPEYDGAACLNVYCHGASLNGGTLTEPKWNDPPENGIVCGMCHGVPPGGVHPVVDADECEECHTDSYSGGELNENHLNGTLNFSVNGDTGVMQ